MISVAAAKQIVVNNVPSPSPQLLSLIEAAGLTLAEEVFATSDFPPFPQSSMDGYAFAFDDWQTNQPLKITGESAAGNDQLHALAKKSAMRIFTGAPLPAGADTVVMQEKTNVRQDALIITDESLQRGSNVRPQGSEVCAGQLALKKETLLTPAAIGFLAGIGISEVKVYRPPVVTIVITGNELQQPGQPLQYGQVYESTSFTLQAALKYFHIPPARIKYMKDHLFARAGCWRCNAWTSLSVSGAESNITVSPATSANCPNNNTCMIVNYEEFHAQRNFTQRRKGSKGAKSGSPFAPLLPLRLCVKPLCVKPSTQTSTSPPPPTTPLPAHTSKSPV